MSSISGTIASLDRRVAEIGRHVVDVDRRLATPEGWITGWQNRENPAG